jgi:hypothetical protein
MVHCFSVFPLYISCHDLFVVTPLFLNRYLVMEYYSAYYNIML